MVRNFSNVLEDRKEKCPRGQFTIITISPLAKEQLTRTDSSSSRKVRRRSVGICVGKTSACTVGLNGPVEDALWARPCSSSV